MFEDGKDIFGGDFVGIGITGAPLFRDVITGDVFSFASLSTKYSEDLPFEVLREGPMLIPDARTFGDLGDGALEAACTNLAKMLPKCSEETSDEKKRNAVRFHGPSIGLDHCVIYCFYSHMSTSPQKILVIVGPTASGKSELGVELAKKFQGEIISADSRQVYRGMDIGTGKVQLTASSHKPTALSYKGIPHHLIDVADPNEDFNVSSFVTIAKEKIEEIGAHENLPIIVGGTGFWVNSLVFGYELPDVVPNKELRDELETHTVEELFEQLQKLDTSRAKHIDKHNKRRLIRALELVMTTGEPIPELKSESQYDALWIGIKIEKDELDARIGKRLKQWLKDGLIEETKELHESGVSWPRLESLGMEYRSVARYLQGTTSEEEMRVEALHSIVQYAKRQMTWFKRNKNIHWITNEEEADKLLRAFITEPTP